MQVISEPSQVQTMVQKWRMSGETIALVPTMGFFHEGHLSLMRWARQNSSKLIVSLFVNPTQFSAGEDLEKYPRDPIRDKKLAEGQGTDILFMPESTSIYSSDHVTWVNIESITDHLCGASRPGHFRGVATIVATLFHICQPHCAVFGEKDWQQLAVIRAMVRDLFFPVSINSMPIVREEDGLALSSRNSYLSDKERKEAPGIYAALTTVQKRFSQGEIHSEALKQSYQVDLAKLCPSGNLDYIEIVDADTMQPVAEVTSRSLAATAVRFKNARLIDNIVLEL